MLCWPVWCGAAPLRRRKIAVCALHPPPTVCHRRQIVPALARSKLARHCRTNRFVQIENPGRNSCEVAGRRSKQGAHGPSPGVFAASEPCGLPDLCHLCPMTGLALGQHRTVLRVEDESPMHAQRAEQEVHQMPSDVCCEASCGRHHGEPRCAIPECPCHCKLRTGAIHE